ncbi:hypothetical protein BJ878DRAFT_500258 [Calycina marina]|uniref:Secreted protein n=1 Tax=Calycina marina TaxID=1763456 RepID=A0A9P7Z6B0_9HELO|nr:hypothetical protein BJ878DRAFT_500258 [Calycina marina]
MLGIMAIFLCCQTKSFLAALALGSIRRRYSHLPGQSIHFCLAYRSDLAHQVTLSTSSLDDPSARDVGHSRAYEVPAGDPQVPRSPEEP